MKTYTTAELDEIIRKHKLWVLCKEGGERAYLQGAYLQGADLRHADLRGAYLRGADLQGADLQGAYLRGADLRRAYLQGAYLRGAYLQGADLQGAYLQGADLRGADLRGAYLRGADLQGAEGVILPIHCPDSGSFVAWKKAGGLIVKLEIPEDAERSSATTRKCRASKAKVLEIQNMDGSIADVLEVKSDRGGVYKVGETIYPDQWDDVRWNECSHGIHFFVTRLEAEQWL